MKPAAGVIALLALFAVVPSAVPADPIHDAAGAGKVEELRRLIAAGTDVNAKNAAGNSPLHDAVLWGHRDIAELLLSKGADVNARDANGMTPLHLAANGDHRKLAELLIAKGAAVDAKALNGWSPLHVAAIWGHENVAGALIAAGADVNAHAFRDAPRLRPSEGTARCHKDIAALLERKAGNDIPGAKAGPTPLTLAILNGQKEMAGLLRKHKAVE